MKPPSTDAMLRELIRLECEESLLAFVQRMWPVVEPSTELVLGDVLEAICDHLEAVTAGTVTRLLINVPPGPMRYDSIVETDKGPKLLIDVGVGERVLTHKGRYRSVEAVHKQGVLPILEIVTDSGRVTHAAPSHPYLTPDGWVDAEDLRTGDTLAVVNPQEDRTAIALRPELARLLGYMVGDGSLTQGTPIFTNADGDVLQDFEACCVALGFEVTKTDRKGVTLVRILGGCKVKQLFETYGLAGKNSYQKRIPQQVMCSDSETMKNFIGAYWSCDGMLEVRATQARGSIYRASCTTVNEKLADDLLYCLGILGIEGRKRRKSRILETVAQPGGSYVSFNVEIQKEVMTARFANMTGLCKRKNELALQCRKTFSQTLWGDVIVSIKPVEPATCLCLTVEEDHSFVCSGIAVKNSMKSLLTDVFWPAWEWTTRPWLRYVAFSYSSGLTERDNRKFLALVSSKEYQELWGERGRGDAKFSLVKQGETLVTNTKMGSKLATSVGGVGTGERGDRVVVDDPHNVKDAESQAVRTSTVEWFANAASNRLNDMKRSAIVIIMQRVHEEDVSGFVISKGLGYTHLMIPAEFEEGRAVENDLGWVDWRSVEGESFWPDRYPVAVLNDLKRGFSPYAYAGQYQQRPEPKGGGILKRDWWKHYTEKAYPACDYKIASIDTAFGEKQENDFSALTIWGVYADKNGIPRALMHYAWQGRVPIHELVQTTAKWCTHFKVDRLLIEAKASGHSLQQELRRLYDLSDWGIQMVDPGRQDKVARVHSVAHLFWEGLVEVPAIKEADGYEAPRAWAQMVIDQATIFPRGAHDDLTDSCVQALRHLRDMGMLTKAIERQQDDEEAMRYTRPPRKLYPV